MSLKVIALIGEILSLKTVHTQRVLDVVAVVPAPVRWRGQVPGLSRGRPCHAWGELALPTALMTLAKSWAFPSSCWLSRFGALWSQSTQYFELINRINTWPIPQKARLNGSSRSHPVPAPLVRKGGGGVAWQPRDV